MEFATYYNHPNTSYVEITGTQSRTLSISESTVNIEPTEKHIDTKLLDATKNKDRLSKMGRSPYGPQKLHRKK